MVTAGSQWTRRENVGRDFISYQPQYERVCSSACKRRLEYPYPIAEFRGGQPKALSQGGYFEWRGVDIKTWHGANDESPGNASRTTRRVDGTRVGPRELSCVDTCRWRLINCARAKLGPLSQPGALRRTARKTLTCSTARRMASMTRGRVALVASWLVVLSGAVGYLQAGGQAQRPEPAATVSAAAAAVAANVEPRCAGQSVLCHLPQRTAEDRRARAREPRSCGHRRAQRYLGKSRTESAGGHDAAAWPAATGQRDDGGVRDVPGNGSGQRRRRARQSRAYGTVSSPQPHGIPQRDPRFAGHRGRRQRRAAGRRGKLRVRQHRGRVEDVAHPDGQLPEHGAKDQSDGCRHAAAGADVRLLPDS